MTGKSGGSVRKRLPLRVRLTLWYLATLAAMLVFFAVFIYWQTQRNLLDQIDSALTLAATQALASVELEGGRLAFEETGTSAAVEQRLGDDFAIYLLSEDGSLRDWMGRRDEFEAQQPRAGLDTVRNDDDLWRVYTARLAPGDSGPGSPGGWLQVAQEMDPVTDALASLQAQMLLGLPLALLLAGFGGFFLAGRALRPIERITATAQAIDGGDLSQRIEYRGPADEVGRLAATFDSMLDRLETAFARERRFTSDAAHELRTPLTAMKGQIEVTLSRSRAEDAYRETLTEINEQVERLIRLSNDLLFMARLDQANGAQVRQEDVALTDLLAAVVDQVKPLAAGKGIELTLTIGERVSVPGDLDLLIRLFLNLLDNAIKYTPPEGAVTVRVDGNGEEVVVAVRDTGPGIPAEHLPHLFERFYRVEADRGRVLTGEGHGGTGLGLAIAAEIVRVHQGAIRAESEVGQGTTFTVRLPSGQGGGRR